MDLTPLTAISAIDGRYRKQVEHLDDYFSEYALMKYRVLIEVEYLLFLAQKGIVKIADQTRTALHDIKENFSVEEKGATEYRPAQLHEFAMYLEGKWYKLTAKAGTYNDNDPIGVLDVTILSDKVLAPLLNIVDLRKDKRIDFVGGLRGLSELKKRVDSGEMKAAFALYAVTMKQLINIADNDLIMPPKVTWFEPKLRSGLVLHSLD